MSDCLKRYCQRRFGRADSVLAVFLDPMRHRGFEVTKFPVFVDCHSAVCSGTASRGLEQEAEQETEYNKRNVGFSKSPSSNCFAEAPEEIGSCPTYGLSSDPVIHMRSKNFQSRDLCGVFKNFFYIAINSPCSDLPRSRQPQLYVPLEPSTACVSRLLL
jgi:hypothetical protein